MSLYALADHMASKGRNGDSTLVHMTPGEVRGLQALALAHGGSLTINPETGLPEANFLKKLLPAIAGLALNTFVPGLGTAIGSALGTTAAVGTGLAVGGATALATGSLSRGLMAGLGAYGGASLGEGLMGAGSDAAVLNSAGTLASGADAAAVADYANKAVAAREAFSAQPFMDRLGQGVSAAIDKPSAFMGSMGGGMKTLQAGYMAASPILADQGVQTATKMPESQGYLRPYVFDPYTQGLQALTPVSHKDAYGPPTGGKAGGLMRLANGGAVAFADGGKTKDIQDWWSANAGKGSQADLDRWLATSGYSAADINAALPQFGVADLNAAIRNAQAQQEVADRQARREALRQQNPGQEMVVSGPETAATLPGPSYTPTPMSAVPQSELDAARAKLDPETANYLDWYSNQINPITGKRNSENPQGANLYADPNSLRGAKEAMERANRREAMGTGYAAEWNDPNWREKQAKREAEEKAYWDRRAAEAAQSNFVTGPGGNTPVVGPGPGGPGTQPGPGTPPPPYTPPPNPVVTPPPPPPPTYVPPDPFDWQKTPITRLPEFGPIKPEDVMSGRSLEAYNALMGKGSTATKQWDQAPMRPYLPQSGNQFFIQRGDTVVDTKNPVSTTTQMPTADPTKMPTQDPGPGMEWYFDNLNKMWLRRPQEQVSGAKNGGVMRGYALGGLGSLGGYSDGGQLLKGPGDGVSDSIPATIGDRRPARLADGEFVVPARIVSELGNGSTEAGARQLYAMMDRVQRARGKTTGKGRVAANTRAEKYLPA